MKKKILNAAELLFLFATFVVLNLKTIEVVSSAVPTEATQFVSTISLWKNYLLSYPIYFFYVVIAIMCVVSIITKSEYREGRIHSILPIIWFILVTIRLIATQGEIRTWIIVSSKQFPQEIFMFFAVGVVVLGFVKRASFITKTTNKQNKSHAKELYDVDVITQEENAETSFDVDKNEKANPKKSKNKKIIILIFIVLFAVAFVFLYKPKFERVKNECVHIVGVVSGRGDYFTIDTNPDMYADMDETTKAIILGDTQEKALEAIRYANEELGFNGSVYSKMLETTALMGRQTEEIDKYRVSWIYHPDDGLEVTYEKK